MPQGDLLKFILRDATPRNIKIIAARGNAPLPPGETLEALIFLSHDADVEIAALAAQTLAGWPKAEILAQLQSKTCGRKIMEHYASMDSPPSVLESIILNPSAPGALVERLAVTVSESLLEAILLNRARILEWPQIVAGVKRNPAATPPILRIVQEIESEFFSGKQSQYTVESEEETESPVPEFKEILGEITLEDLSLEGLPVDPQAREGAILDRLAKMTVRQKIQMAILGNREMRSILIRDSNKEVARSVLQSPKMNENEIESFAAMRNISDEILREIGKSRRWTRSYNTVVNLVKNPKTPPMISQHLLFRLMKKDLGLLARDRSVSEPIRKTAQRMVTQRSSAQSH